MNFEESGARKLPDIGVYHTRHTLRIDLAGVAWLQWFSALLRERHIISAEFSIILARNAISWRFDSSDSAATQALRVVLKNRLYLNEDPQLKGSSDNDSTKQLSISYFDPDPFNKSRVRDSLHPLSVENTCHGQFIITTTMNVNFWRKCWVVMWHQYFNKLYLPLLGRKSYETLEIW
jgi:hypothetical protein